MIVFAREKDKENSYENMPNTVRPISSDPDYIVSYNKNVSLLLGHTVVRLESPLK